MNAKHHLFRNVPVRFKSYLDAGGDCVTLSLRICGANFNTERFRIVDIVSFARDTENEWKFGVSRVKMRSLTM